MLWERHGQSKSQDYATWLSIKDACTNPNSPRWFNYGRLGIKICNEWKYSFSQFIKDVGPRPKNLFLKRINKKGHFEPKNVIWDIRPNSLFKKKKLIQFYPNFKHDLRQTYRNMIQRCTNPKNSNWHYYGGRGISVCERWLNSFDNFKEDVGEKLVSNLSIDRIDNDGNYEPNNIKWATPMEQMLHTRKHKNPNFGIHYYMSTDSFHLVLRINGKQKYLGTFKTKEEAKLARDEANIRFKLNMVFFT